MTYQKKQLIGYTIVGIGAVALVATLCIGCVRDQESLLISSLLSLSVILTFGILLASALCLVRVRK